MCRMYVNLDALMSGFYRKQFECLLRALGEVGMCIAFVERVVPKSDGPRCEAFAISPVFTQKRRSECRSRILGSVSCKLIHHRRQHHLLFACLI